MDICKLYQVGNSVGMTIPAWYRRELGWRLGTHVYIEIEEHTRLTVRSVESAPKTTPSLAASGPGRLTKVTRRARVPRD